VFWRGDGPGFPSGLFCSTQIVLRMLVKVFCRDRVAAAGGRFPRQHRVPLEELMGVAADLEVWAIAVEMLAPV
jgi:hypothetical protein